MDKNKIIQTATRYTQRGQIDKAISEYQRIVDWDPSDVRALLKIGELQQRQGDLKQAAETLQRAAEAYASDGFFLKAVAVYKQVLKLAPKMEVNQRLADLYQQLGLMSDAMGQLQLVATAYESAGRTKDTVAVLRKMMDLDPENVIGRIRLAELLGTVGEAAEALQELTKALHQLEVANRTDEYLRVAERMLSLDPDNLPLARKAASQYLKKGDARRALARLQPCFKAEPRSIETLELLAQAFIALGEEGKGISVYREIARLHREEGKTQEERGAWQKILRLSPRDPAALEAVAGAPQTTAAPPVLQKAPQPPISEAIPVPPPSGGGRVPPPPPTPGRTPNPVQAGPQDAGRLLAELDVYLKYKLYPKAKDHLRALLSIDPRSRPVQERALAMAEGAGDAAGRRDALVALIRLCVEAGDEQAGREYLEKLASGHPDDPELPALRASLDAGADSVAEAEVILVDDAEEEGEEIVIGASVTDEPLILGVTEASVSGMGIEEDAAIQAAIDVSTAEEVTVDEPLLDEPPVPRQAPPPGQALPPALLTSIRSDLEEADFYRQQGMDDEAEEILLSILQRAPGFPEAQSRLEALGRPPAPRLQAASEPAGKPPPPSFAGPAAPLPVPQSGRTFDLAAELLEDLAPEPTPGRGAPVADFQYSVEEVLAEFKKGVSQTVRPEDSETHYNLGIAYKEMGLLSDAISQFEVAQRGCLGSRREVDCLITAGLCHAELGDREAALESFRKGLGAAAVTAEAALALHYEIGQCYEALQNFPQALEHYGKVQRVDSGYRDVGRAIERLRRNQGASQEFPGSELKTGKVGYV